MKTIHRLSFVCRVVLMLICSCSVTFWSLSASAADAPVVTPLDSMCIGDSTGRLRTLDAASCFSTHSNAVVVIHIRQVDEVIPRLTVRYFSMSLSNIAPGSGWLSIRRDFSEVQDLSGASGLRVLLTILESTDSIFRITLSDNVPHNGTDLWWSDTQLPATKLGDEVPRQVIIDLPFEAFDPCYGIGCRRNDGKLDLRRIAAYEMNFVPNGEIPFEGEIRIDGIDLLKRPEG